MRFSIQHDAARWRRSRRRHGPQVQDRVLRRAPSREVPANLRYWYCDATLVAWIEQEIPRLNWNDPHVCQYLRQHPEHDPAGLLAILALALLSQLFASEEIAQACRSDPLFDSFCRGRPPFPHELGSVRRKNRRLLEEILTRVLTRAISKNLGLAPTLLPAKLESDLRADAIERLDLARHADMG